MIKNNERRSVRGGSRARRRTAPRERPRIENIIKREREREKRESIYREGDKDIY